MALERMESTAFETMSVEEIEARLDEISESGRPLILTRNGKEAFVIGPYEWWRKVVPGPHPGKDVRDDE